MFGAAALGFDIAGGLSPVRTLVLCAGVCLLIATPLAFMDDHRRKRLASLDGTKTH